MSLSFSSSVKQPPRFNPEVLDQLRSWALEEDPLPSLSFSSSVKQPPRVNPELLDQLRSWALEEDPLPSLSLYTSTAVPLPRKDREKIVLWQSYLQIVQTDIREVEAKIQGVIRQFRSGEIDQLPPELPSLFKLRNNLKQIYRGFKEWRFESNPENPSP